VITVPKHHGQTDRRMDR